MRATDLKSGIWNSIADLVQRSRSNREIYFDTVIKADDKAKVIWTQGYGDTPIPLVSHTYSFAYFDSVADNAAGPAFPSVVTSKKMKRFDATHKNPLYLTEIVTPSVGDLVIILDPWGEKTFPICIGTIQSKQPFWEVSDDAG